MAGQDHYTLLEVSTQSDSQSITGSYRRLALLHHPDRNRELDSTARFQKIQAAYEILSDPVKRRKYDLETGGGTGDGRRDKRSPKKNHNHSQHRAPTGGRSGNGWKREEPPSQNRTHSQHRADSKTGSGRDQGNFRWCYQHGQYHYLYTCDNEDEAYSRDAAFEEFMRKHKQYEHERAKHAQQEQEGYREPTTADLLAGLIPDDPRELWEVLWKVTFVVIYVWLPCHIFLHARFMVPESALQGLRTLLFLGFGMVAWWWALVIEKSGLDFKSALIMGYVLGAYCVVLGIEEYSFGGMRMLTQWMVIAFFAFVGIRYHAWLFSVTAEDVRRILMEISHVEQSRKEHADARRRSEKTSQPNDPEAGQKKERSKKSSKRKGKKNKQKQD